MIYQLASLVTIIPYEMRKNLSLEDVRKSLTKIIFNTTINKQNCIVTLKKYFPILKNKKIRRGLINRKVLRILNKK